MNPLLDADQSESILMNIIQEIQNNCNLGSWFISSDKIIECLNLEKEEYFKRIYKLSSYKFEAKYSKGFSNFDSEALIKFLKYYLKINHMEEIFAVNGISLSDHYRNELIFYLKKLIQLKAKQHHLDKDLLFLLINSTKTYDDAFESYFLDKFNVHLIIQNGILDFLDEKNIDISFGIDYLINQYILSIYDSQVFHLKTIVNEYKEKVYFEIYGKKRKKKKKVSIIIDPEKAKLLEFFDLEEDAGKEDLKKRFKVLLKKYHPDINKDGLEMTKQITLNYDLLIQLIE